MRSEGRAAVTISLLLRPPSWLRLLRLRSLSWHQRPRVFPLLANPLHRRRRVDPTSTVSSSKFCGTFVVLLLGRDTQTLQWEELALRAGGSTASFQFSSRCSSVAGRVRASALHEVLLCDHSAVASPSHPTRLALRVVQVVFNSSRSSTTSPTKRSAPQCGPCSDAIVGRITTACVSSPWDWAVSTSKHMQKNMGILLHASLSGRALFLFLRPFPQCGCYIAWLTPRRAIIVWVRPPNLIHWNWRIRVSTSKSTVQRIMFCSGLF